MRKKIMKVDLPAAWASALINNDRTGLTRYPEDLDEFECWAKENPHLLNPIDCSEHEFVGRWDGLLCDMLTYIYYVEE